VHGSDLMRFIYDGREYEEGSAVEILRKIDGDIKLCSGQRFSVRTFVNRSLVSLSDQIHQRELSASDHLSDETLALSYLCLLDEYAIGRLDMLTTGTGTSVRK
jgi:hypothetical protein